MQKPNEPEAFWKASVTIELPVAAYAEDIAFRCVDMKAFAKTLTKNVHSERGKIAKFISPARTQILDEDTFSGRISLPARITSWLLLECIVPEIRDHVIYMMKENLKLFPNAWFGGNRKMPLMLSVMLYHETEGGCDEYEASP